MVPSIAFAKSHSTDAPRRSSARRSSARRRCPFITSSRSPPDPWLPRRAAIHGLPDTSARRAQVVGGKSNRVVSNRINPADHRTSAPGGRTPTVCKTPRPHKLPRRSHSRALRLLSERGRCLFQFRRHSVEDPRLFRRGSMTTRFPYRCQLPSRQGKGG